MVNEKIKEEKVNQKDLEFKSVESEIFKFENAGDELIGVLIKKEAGLVYDNEVYKIRERGSDKIRTVFGTVMLSSLMNAVEIGSLVKITLVGFKENTKKGQHDIKMFDVGVA